MTSSQFDDSAGISPNEPVISLKEVEHVAALARVAITPEERSLYQGQLAKILGYIAKLKEVDTAGVPPTAHPFDSSNVWREDEVKPFGNIPGLLANAPETEETFYRVKKVIE
jgi:aspartyl-tRNA(Asn)/glutamyl-tRNA(Gln) amidotransferase subunit C